MTDTRFPKFNVSFVDFTPRTKEQWADVVVASYRVPKGKYKVFDRAASQHAKEQVENLVKSGELEDVGRSLYRRKLAKVQIEFMDETGNVVSYDHVSPEAKAAIERARAAVRKRRMVEQRLADIEAKIYADLENE